MKRLFAIALLLSTAGAVHAQSSGEVRIYRCTDAAGKQTLRDTPCPKGQQQQTRDMLRPKDAPAKPAPPPSPKAAPAPVTTRTVYLAPPRPMYECTTFEGKRYTSDNGDGNPRWQPYWTLGYPVYGGRPRPPKGASEAFITALRKFDRQALHATMLRLYHPISGIEMEWHAPIPQDMVELIEAMRADYEDHKDDIDWL